MKAWVEREYRVGLEDSAGCFVSIAAAPDFPESGVLLYTDGEKNEAYFGKIYFQGSLDLMRKIGESLIACANDVEAQK